MHTVRNKWEKRERSLLPFNAIVISYEQIIERTHKTLESIFTKIFIKSKDTERVCRQESIA